MPKTTDAKGLPQCPKCQYQNQEGDKFCRECGTKLSSVCPQCGREVNPQDKFCAECGTRLGKAMSATTEMSVPKLEDMHWSDDLSLDLISLLMDELANAPLLLVCVYRPEKEHRVWQLGAQARRKCLDRYTEITLHPLSSHQSRLLVESLLAIENLPERIKEVIMDKSEGNPFFIEEVIRSLIEQDMVYREGDHWKARDEISGISVPDTIQSVVLARVEEILLSLGNPKDAELHQGEALRLVEKIGRNWSIAWISSNLGEIAMCQHHWDEAISHYQRFVEESERSYGHGGRENLQLAKAYLKKGEIHSAIQRLETAAYGALGRDEWFAPFPRILAMMEEAYTLLGTPEKFSEFCHSLKERQPDKVSKEQLKQWYLESAQPSGDFADLAFSDDFCANTINSSWLWIDELEDCAYIIADDGKLEIDAANGRDLAWIN